jgi:hypothetical protein
MSVLRIDSNKGNNTLIARAALAKPWRLKSRSWVRILKPHGLTGVQCGRGEGCNTMSQQNLEEETGCGQTDCRKMKQQAMAKLSADSEAGNCQATRLQENFLEILLSQTHTHHIVVLSSCHIALL